MSIHDDVAQSLSGLGGVLRCQQCGRVRQVGYIGSKLASGWPKCCGYTMRWWTQRQIDAGEVTL